MEVVFGLLAVLILCFGFVIAFGAPYLPTLNKQISVALDLLDLKPGQTLIELGCGDGRVMIAAAKRGIRVVGYELNPLLVVVCWLRTLRYRKLISVRLVDFWRTDWPPADGVFGFILPKYMTKLDKKITNEKRIPLRVVSFAFMIPGKRAVKEREGVYLYEYK